MEADTKHARDCAYVVTDGPAPCTCHAGKEAAAFGRDICERCNSPHTCREVWGHCVKTLRPLIASTR